MIFFVVSDLVHVDPMYAFSMEWYMTIYERALLVSAMGEGWEIGTEERRGGELKGGKGGRRRGGKGREGMTEGSRGGRWRLAERWGGIVTPTACVSLLWRSHAAGGAGDDGSVRMGGMLAQGGGDQTNDI